MSPRSTPSLLLVGAATLALVGLSWGMAQVDLGSWSTPVALGIATVKAGLIAWFFMELGEMRTSVRVAAVASLLLFLLLVGLATTDVATRVPPPLLPPETGAP